jgi:hypothetical protein
MRHCRLLFGEAKLGDDSCKTDHFNANIETAKSPGKERDKTISREETQE